MKRKRMIFMTGLVSVAITSGLLLTNIFAETAQPGSTADPLVSKSYVDNKINQALGGTGTVAAGGLSQADRDAIVKAVVAEVNGSGGPAVPYTGESSVMTQFSPVNIAPGQILIGYEGTEIILRSGKATGYCEGANGLVDITDGTEIGSDTDLKLNHLIIVPRYESRGVKATTSAWLMVKGGYEILN